MAVLVAVVEIGPVRVRMHDRLVPVPVDVPDGRGQTRVLVQVVAVVVPMGVDVLDRSVRARMLVTRAQQQRDGAASRSAPVVWPTRSGSPSTPHARAAPTNGAVANTACARVAPSCWAADTRSAMLAP